MSNYAQGSRERYNGNKENFNYKIKKHPTPRNQNGLLPCTNLHVLSNIESADTLSARAITHSLLLSQQLCLLGETKNPKQQTTAPRPHEGSGPCLAQCSGDFSPTIMASYPARLILAPF